jgi:hypothetical protein
VPWETEADPPSPDNERIRSCLPEHVILRQQAGDPRYLAAFARLLDNS